MDGTGGGVGGWGGGEEEGIVRLTYTRQESAAEWAEQGPVCKCKRGRGMDIKTEKAFR